MTQTPGPEHSDVHYPKRDIRLPPMKEPKDPFAEEQEESAPLWRRLLFSPLFWPVPALLCSAIVLLKGKKLWVLTGRIGRQTSAGRELLIMLAIGLIGYYIPWHRILSNFGNVMGGATISTMRGQMRTSGADGGCAGIFIRTMSLCLIYFVAYVYWRRYM